MSFRRRGRISWLGITLLAVLLGLAVQSATAKPPPTLAGAMFQAGSGELGEFGTSQVSGTCNPSGTSTFEFTVTGFSFWDPYPGTFTESGTFTLGPAVTQPDGNIVLPPIAFEATFTLESGTTTITGHKTLSPKPVKPFSFGGCGELLAPFGWSTPNAAWVEVRARYVAEIPMEAGKTVIDRGESRVIVSDLGVRNTPFAPFQFIEDFLINQDDEDNDEDG